MRVPRRIGWPDRTPGFTVTRVATRSTGISKIIARVLLDQRYRICAPEGGGLSHDRVAGGCVRGERWRARHSDLARRVGPRRLWRGWIDGGGEHGRLRSAVPKLALKFRELPFDLGHNCSCSLSGGIGIGREPSFVMLIDGRFAVCLPGKGLFQSDYGAFLRGPEIAVIERGESAEFTAESGTWRFQNRPESTAREFRACERRKRDVCGRPVQAGS